MGLESGARYLLFFAGIGLLAGMLVYGSIGELPISMPSPPSGEVSGLDLVVYLLNSLFSFMANGIILLVNGITLSWIPSPWRFIVGLPFWGLGLLVAIHLVSGMIDKLRGWF